MKNVRIHCLQHVSFEGIGCIAAWAEAQGHLLSHTKFYENALLPDLSAFDCLLVMGGPMSVHDEDVHVWLKAEKAFIKNAMDAGKKVIGICLGSQLIAITLGADVYANAEKEIGWLPITFSKEAKELFPFLKDDETVFHWHGDTFDLPTNAVRMAQSEACLNQAYKINKQVLGLQFHLEVTKDALAQMLHNGADELVDAKYIQSAENINEQQNLIPQNNQLLMNLIDRFLEM